MTTYSMTAGEIGQALNITDRRVRQLAEEGLLPRLERGKYDLGWAAYLIGSIRAFDGRIKKPNDPRVMVAFSWLAGCGEAWQNDLPMLRELFVRNGYTAEDALIAVGQAQAWGR